MKARKSIAVVEDLPMVEVCPQRHVLGVKVPTIVFALGLLGRHQLHAGQVGAFSQALQALLVRQLENAVQRIEQLLREFFVDRQGSARTAPGGAPYRPPWQIGQHEGQAIGIRLEQPLEQVEINGLEEALAGKTS